MTTTEGRIAVLESLSERNERDIMNLFKLVREHMEKEEKDREETIGLISKLDKKMDQQKYFISGVIAAISTVWGIAVSVLNHVP